MQETKCKCLLVFGDREVGTFHKSQLLFKLRRSSFQSIDSCKYCFVRFTTEVIVKFLWLQ